MKIKIQNSEVVFKTSVTYPSIWDNGESLSGVFIRIAGTWGITAVAESMAIPIKSGDVISATHSADAAKVLMAITTKKTDIVNNDAIPLADGNTIMNSDTATQTAGSDAKYLIVTVLESHGTNYKPSVLTINGENAYSRRLTPYVVG